jgi:hypothetical protein
MINPKLNPRTNDIPVPPIHKAWSPRISRIVANHFKIRATPPRRVGAGDSRKFVARTHGTHTPFFLEKILTLKINFGVSHLCFLGEKPTEVVTTQSGKYDHFE